VELKAMMEEVAQVHVSPSIVKHVRDVFSAVRSHPFVACGLPPRAAESLLQCIRIQAVLRRGAFAIPQDFTLSVIETLAHRIIVVPSKVLPTEYANEHQVYLARMIVGAATSSLLGLR
jgi:MoxR-like ATPase